MRNHPIARTARRQSGASLLEVLIAILIMSFGLLALGGLAAASIQYGKLAQFQTIGVQLASEYADRMRANADAFPIGGYDKKTVYSGSSSLVSVPSCAVAILCSSAEIANIDKAEWINSLRQRLPGVMPMCSAVRQTGWLQISGSCGWIRR